MLLRYRICFVIVLLYAFSLLLLFFLFHNLFCKIVLLEKRVNHFDRKKKVNTKVCKYVNLHTFAEKKNFSWGKRKGNI